VKKFSRRAFLVTAGASGAGVALAAGGYALGHTNLAAVPAPSEDVVPFHGMHQAGIATPAQDHLAFAAFDVVTKQREDVRALLQNWTAAAATLSLGKQLGAESVAPTVPFPDTGEAREYGSSRLTITIGFGPTLFTKDGQDRYGLAARRPEALIDLPAFPHEALDPTRVGGDLCVQACADNPQVAFHAVHNLTRLARGVAVMRWSQLGFNRTASTSTGQATPRNLMGFKDGTNNLKAEQTDLIDKHVWVDANDSPAWMQGGSYLVARRIRMRLEAWDRDASGDQEAVFGRYKVSGAPLGQQHEFDQVDLDANDADGKPIIPMDAHVRLAIGDGSIKILRRGYSFTDGMDPRTGQLDAGLFFLAYQRNPRTQFVPLQQRLAQHDALNEYIVHVGSGIFACPPGAQSGSFLGEALFDG
jgi:deferrochelatase/peroxidase EfeB